MHYVIYNFHNTVLYIKVVYNTLFHCVFYCNEVKNHTFPCRKFNFYTILYTPRFIVILKSVLYYISMNCTMYYCV